MSFNYNVSFSDAAITLHPQDIYVRQALNDALGAWSQYLNGAGTLNIQLNVTSLGGANANGLTTLANANSTATTFNGFTPDGHDCP